MPPSIGETQRQKGHPVPQILITLIILLPLPVSWQWLKLYFRSVRLASTLWLGGNDTDTEGVKFPHWTEGPEGEANNGNGTPFGEGILMVIPSKENFKLGQQWSE